MFGSLGAGAGHLTNFLRRSFCDILILQGWYGVDN